MAGILHGPSVEKRMLENPTPLEELMLALALCPRGKMLILHSEDCNVSQVRDCDCYPDVLTPGVRGVA